MFVVYVWCSSAHAQYMFEGSSFDMVNFSSVGTALNAAADGYDGNPYVALEFLPDKTVSDSALDLYRAIISPGMAVSRKQLQAAGVAGGGIYPVLESWGESIYIVGKVDPDGVGSDAGHLRIYTQSNTSWNTPPTAEDVTVANSNEHAKPVLVYDVGAVEQPSLCWTRKVPGSADDALLGRAWPTLRSTKARPESCPTSQPSRRPNPLATS